MSSITRAASAALLLGAAIALGGCSFSIGNAHPTSVGSSQVEGLAEDALEAQVGTRPSIDCGADDFALENGSSRTCVLTDPSSGTQYDADVTLSDVDGTEFHVDVEVATAPRE